MIYSDFVTALGGLLEYPITNANSANPSSNTDFNNALPRAIEYTENRIQRELDLITTFTTDTGSLTPNTRLFTLPTTKGTYVVINQVAPIVNSVRQPPILPVAREFLDAVWPTEASPFSGSVPQVWAIYDQQHILVGPSPDLNYTLEIVGTQRVVPLSSSNTSNFLTLSLPDLYTAAAMIWFSGWTRDFGQQSDDPSRALSWEKVYSDLREGATVEEARKKWKGEGWNSRMPSPIAKPSQT